MTVREEYEYLKTELFIKLADATPMCNLEFPYNFFLSNEEEIKYFQRGNLTRLALKKAIIILDNTYQKIKLFPSEDIISTFLSVQKDILKDMKKSVLEAYTSEEWRYKELPIEEYGNYIDELSKRIIEASKPYMEALKKVDPKDVEREIAAKDKLKQPQGTSSILKNNQSQNKKGLF